MRPTRRRLLLICFVLLACASFLTWYRLPNIYVGILGGLDKSDEEGCAWVAKRLSGCGPRATPVVIEAIRTHSPWAMCYCYLPFALEGIGEPAHQSLLRAIDSETDAEKQAYLIYSLQAAFADYSRFDLWLAAHAARPKNEWEIQNMGMCFREHFRQAPPIVEDHALNPQFVDWWKQRAKAGGAPVRTVSQDSPI
jgi:hypothetical protein